MVELIGDVIELLDKEGRVLVRTSLLKALDLGKVTNIKEVI